MFKSLQDFFNSKNKAVQRRKSSSNRKSESEELRLAAATLMFEVVRSDGRVDRTELIAMGEVLRQQFDFSEEDIGTMIELAKSTSEDAISLQGFTREICEGWGNSKRMKLVEQLWVIALADKNIDAHERHTVRKVAALLYLNEAQIVQAKENAKNLLGMDDF